MKAARIHAPRDLRIDDVPEPVIRDGAVKIKVSYAGICGSDLGLYLAAPVPDAYEHPLVHEQGPHVLGHEFSGYVTEIGDGVDGIAVGDLVAVRPAFYDGTCAACLRGESNICDNWGFIGIHGGGGGFSEFVVVDAPKVFVLPDRFTPEYGALVESLSVAWHAVRLSGATSGSTALIVGAGPIGLGLLLSLRAAGVERIVMSELGEQRKKLAASLGADVIDPRETDPIEYVKSLTNGAGVDASFDASGAGNATFSTAIAALRNGGSTVVVANFHEPVSVDLAAIMSSEKKILGSLAYTDEDFAAVISAIQTGAIDPSALVTKVIPLADIDSDGFIDLIDGDGRSTQVKILVDPAR